MNNVIIVNVLIIIIIYNTLLRNIEIFYQTFTNNIFDHAVPLEV